MKRFYLAIALLFLWLVSAHAANPRPGGADGIGIDQIADEGSNLTKRPAVNFSGNGVTCTDNAGATRTDCSIPGGGGGGTGVGRASLSATWSAIADGACQQQTATWTGVTTADTVILGAPSGLAAGLITNVRVSAADTVAIRVCNLSGASVNPGAQTFSGTLAVYNLSGSSTIDFAAIADGACASNTFTLAGVAAGDPVAPRWPTALEAGLFGSMVSSATDTLQVRLCNLSGASVNPASQTFGGAIAK